jgi:tetratricopeptide (TPR) repeat protein
MRSTPDPSLRGLTTDLLKSLDAQNRLRAVSLPSGSRGLFDRPASGKQADAKSEEADSTHRLAILYHKRKNYEKAERLYQETLTILGLTRGTMDRAMGQLLNNVARLYVETGWYSEAEPLLIRSLEIARHHFGAGSSKVARRLTNLAEMCVETQRDEDALQYFQKAISIETRELGADHAQTMASMRACAALRCCAEWAAITMPSRSRRCFSAFAARIVERWRRVARPLPTRASCRRESSRQASAAAARTAGPRKLAAPKKYRRRRLRKLTS